MLDPTSAFDRDGFVVFPSVFSPTEVTTMNALLDASLTGADAVLRSSQAVFGARNLLQIWPAAATVWRKEPLVEFAKTVLGPNAGVVRGLYFDKPPEQSWTLPLHRDKTIAVREHRPLTNGFAHPTTKAGVPHVEAPSVVLEQMLTLRIHLDPMTADNGPLLVVPRSHHSEVYNPGDAVTPLGPAGDVLAMRPLLVHGSRHSSLDNSIRRRIVHLELARSRKLPGEMEWHQFIPIED